MLQYIEKPSRTNILDGFCVVEPRGIEPQFEIVKTVVPQRVFSFR